MLQLNAKMNLDANLYAENRKRAKKLNRYIQ